MLARDRRPSTTWQRTLHLPVVGIIGAADDLAAFLAGRSRSAPAGARGRRSREAEPPVVRLDGDVLVVSRLLADSVPPGVRAGQSRVLDVYVRRGGQWKWLAHQSSEARPRRAPVSPEPAPSLLPRA